MTRDAENPPSGFLSRWSRRKREAIGDDEGGAQPNTAPAELSEPPGPAPPDADPDAVTQEEIDALPPVETVTERAGLEPFFRKGVPPALRNAARRRMWMLNPTISTYLDVARDYAYDWNTPGGVPGSGGSITPEAAARIAERLLARSDWRGKLREENAVPATDDASPELETAEPVAGTVSDRDPAEAPAESPGESVEAPETDEGETAEAGSASRTFVEYRPHAGVAETPTDEPPARPRRHGGAIPR